MIAAELCNYTSVLREALRRHKVVAALYVIAILLLGQWRPAQVVLWLIAVALLAGAVIWRYRDGANLDIHRFRVWQRRQYVHVTAVWPELMLRLGLAIRLAPAAPEVPRISTGRWHGHSLVLVVGLPLGMERDRLALSASAIAESLGAVAVTVEVAPNGAEVVIRFADPLTQPVMVPDPGDDVDLRAVPMGIQASGAPWTLRVGPHTLVAGSSGSGKASIIWSLLIGLSPAIREGRIEVYGVDLKGGMELTMGRALLTQYATESEAAVILLERAVVRMQERAAQLAGNVREHTAAVESPHVLVVIDELAALTAYQTDRDLLRRANNALALLCSQGRAPGFTVFACLQDPRKETLPVRGLFTQTIGLRLRDAMETSMVLGEGMREKGALCHRIPPTLPGVAYVVPDNGGDPLRVRAGYALDDVIRYTAERYPAPRQEAIVVPADVPTDPEASSPRPRRPRRSRKTGEEA
ncbi:FtsK/SpoIIIE domain-containing protein [Okibacterium endophyticum]